MSPQDTRYHALDSMRATMMLLGIYLHVVVGTQIYQESLPAMPRSVHDGPFTP